MEWEVGKGVSSRPIGRSVGWEGLGAGAGLRQDARQASRPTQGQAQHTLHRS